jgi:hypothetical protein
MTEFCCEHTFRTTISTTKFQALVTKACRSPFVVEVIGHDPGVVPQVRLFTVGFATPDDRDRVRIAMRFVEKELAAASPPIHAPAAGSRLATA